MSLLASMVLALTLTELLEILFSLLWGLRRHQLVLVLLMNLLTNPAVNFLYTLFVSCLGCPAGVTVLVLELSVVLTEYRCCRGIVPKPLLFALFVNGFSYGAGFLLQALF